MAGILLDTNALLYAEDADAGERRVRAQEIVAGAIAGCGRLMTEDLQDGQIVEGAQIVNPFRISP